MTRWLCLFGRHAPGPRIVANGGYRFSQCRRCGRPIVQSVVSGWRVPAKGFAIVWKDREEVRPAAPPPLARRPALPKPPADDFMQPDDRDFDWARDPAPVKDSRRSA